MRTIQLRLITTGALLLACILSCRNKTEQTRMDGPMVKIDARDSSLNAYLDRIDELVKSELSRMTGIPFLANATDSIRLHITEQGSPITSNKQRLYYFENKDQQWTARMVTYRVERSEKADSLQVHIEDLKSHPGKLNGQALLDKLTAFNIFTLPDQDSIPGYGGGYVDADAVLVDFSTPTRHRSYHYNSIYANAPEFEQAKQLQNCIAYLEKLFRISRLDPKSDFR